MMIQADYLAASRKLIPNFETWAQCFALYAAIRITEQPSLAEDLTAYFFSGQEIPLAIMDIIRPVFPRGISVDARPAMGKRGCKPLCQVL